jgi:predicted secreted protein
MSVQNGDVVILQVGGVQVGALVSNSHNMTADMLDKSNKDTPGVKQYDAGETGWTLSLESLYDHAASEGASEALGYLKAGTLLSVIHGVPAGTFWQGSAYISSIEISGPKNEISSYSLELQGSGVYGGYVSQYQTIYNAMTNKPASAVALAQNTMVASLISAGIWSKLDVFYVLAQYSNADSEALINWINPGTYDITLGGTPSPSFVSLEGFTSNGSNGYLDTNWNPSTHGVNFIQDDAGVFAYLRTNVADTSRDFGAQNGSNIVNVYPRDGSDASRSTLNCTASTYKAGETDTRGLWYLHRDNSANHSAYRNGSLLNTTANASTGVPNAEMWLLCHNNAGSPQNISV